MRRLVVIALVIGTSYAGVLRAQGAQSDVVKADQALTEALQGGNRTAAARMLDADFSWIDGDGIMYLGEDAFRAGVKPLVGTSGDVKVLEHKYNKVVYIQRSLGKDKFSGHFWVQRPAGWRLLHINDLQVRQRDYQVVQPTFPVPCVNPCQALPYKPIGAGEKAALLAWQEQEGSSAGWDKHVASNYDQRAINTYGGESASKADRIAAREKNRQANPNRPQVGAAPVAWARGWDFGDAVVWVMLQPTYGDKPYWSSRVYANINGTWQMAESYHTYIKDAPVMSPVPAGQKSTNQSR
jgi:hypothetical protein